MNDIELPLVRTKSVGDSRHSLLLVEALSPQPPVTPVMVVLDFSDSCVEIGDSIRRLSGLLAKASRDAPLYFLQLSSDCVLNEKSANTVAHLQDGSIDTTRWLNDQKIREQARDSGSFLRPTLDAVKGICRREVLSMALLIVLTDGELLDRSRLRLPDGITLLGITASTTPQSQTHWRRVVGDAPLFSWRDSRLNDVPSLAGTTRRDAIQVAFEELNDASNYKVFQIEQDARLLATSQLSSITWYPNDGPLRLAIQTEKDTLGAAAISFRIDGQVVKQPFSDIGQTIDDATLAKMKAAIADLHTDRTWILFNGAVGDPTFNLAWKAMQEVARLAEGRELWNSQSFPLIFIQQILTESNKSGESTVLAADAIVCLCTDLPTAESVPSGRVAMIGLQKASDASINWMKEVKMQLGAPDTLLRIRYDRMEGRWILCMGSESEAELEPRGSQSFPGTILIDGITWHGFFSGPLDRTSSMERQSPVSKNSGRLPATDNPTEKM